MPASRPSSGSWPRPRPSPACSTPTSCRSTISARPTACRSSSWSTSPAAAWTGGSTARPGRPGGRPSLVEALARGVAEAHRQGIVHRDLKPGNVLLAADGTPKVTDFGLAKSLGADSGLTRTDSIMGSPGYMAPEQAEGKTKRGRAAGRRLSLGAILYELLTGGPPFRGTTALEILDQVKNAEPVAPSRLVPACRGTSRRSR